MIVVSPRHPARPTTLSVRRLRRTVTLEVILEVAGSGAPNLLPHWRFSLEARVGIGPFRQGLRAMAQPTARHSARSQPHLQSRANRKFQEFCARNCVGVRPVADRKARVNAL